MYAKLSDDLWTHPKIKEVGNEAVGVFVQMISYCAQHSEGEVPDNVAFFIAQDMTVLEKLAEAKLIEKRKGGWFIPSYLDHNISRDEWAERRRKKNERQQRWREKREAEQNNGKKPHSVDDVVDAIESANVF